MKQSETNIKVDTTAVSAPDVISAADSVVADTTVRDTTYVLVPVAPDVPDLHRYTAEDDTGISWILTILIAMFTLVAIRYRKNSRFLSAVLKEVTNIRERSNQLDDTVREVSFMLILNLLWVISSGILLYYTLQPAIDKGIGLALCVGCTLVYEIGLTAAYTLCGSVFSTPRHTRMWVRGFWAAQSLATLLMFPIAILLICTPAPAGWAVITGWIAFALTKILFIWKGFRIFFEKITSWVLFLYYLCSLEIVPVIVVYGAAVFLTSEGMR